MGLFADSGDTFRVELGDGWVEARALITLGDKKFAQDAATGKLNVRSSGGRRSRGADADTDISTEWSQQRYISALLSKMIVSWSEDAPVTMENVERLPERSTDAIMEALNERNADRTEEERSPLSRTPTLPSEPHRENGVSEAEAVSQVS